MRSLVRWIGAALVVGIAVGAAMFGVHEYESRHPSSDGNLPPGGDRVAEATAALVADHLYVAPELAHLIDPQAQARVAAAAAASDPAAFIALAGKGDAGYYLDADLAQYLMNGVAVDGSYLVWDGEGQYGTERTRGGTIYSVDYDMSGKTEAALMRYVDSVDSETLEEPDSSDYWGGPGGGIAAALLMVVSGYLGLILVVGIVRALAGSTYFLPGRWRDFFVGSDA
ncbi:hypothetical protein [Mumia sp. Pv 4-285]|uniref:hypothetical protein n=1 Tax=Mumia qirimensis TaxID=3234852 RepID=UPI00351D6C85